MILIFLFSSQNATESNRTSGATFEWITETFMSNSVAQGTLMKELSEKGLRKIAHFFIYFCLGVTTFLAGKEWSKVTHKRYAHIAWIVATIYACTDEFHQYFIPGRSCEIKDVCLDSAGALCGILFVWLILKLIDKIRK